MDEPQTPAAVATAARTRIKPWESLKYRDFRLLWMGFPFSNTGQWMRNTTNAYQVYHLTGSPSALGLTFLFQGAPSLVMGLFGGTLADILPRRNLIRATMSAQILLACLLAILTLTHHIHVWHIYAITFATSTLSSFENPARQTLIPQLVPRELVLNATALQSTAGQLALLLGPLLGGTLIDTVGAGWAYVLNALLVLPAFIAISLLHLLENPNRRKVRLNLANIFEGLRFAIGTHVLIWLLLVDWITMVFGYYPALMAVIADEVLHVSGIGFGALLAAAPAGSILGLFVILWLGNVQRKGILILACVTLHGLVLIAFSFSHIFALSLLLIGMLGLLDSMSVSVRQTSFLLVAKEENRGRVMSLVQIFAQSSNNLGGAYLGFTASLMGPHSALLVGGIVGASFTASIALFKPKVRNFRAG